MNLRQNGWFIKSPRCFIKSPPVHQVTKSHKGSHDWFFVGSSYRPTPHGTKKHGRFLPRIRLMFQKSGEPVDMVNIPLFTGFLYIPGGFLAGFLVAINSFLIAEMHPLKGFKIHRSESCSRCKVFLPFTSFHRIDPSYLFRWDITLPETNIFAENGWLEGTPFLLRWLIFRGKLAVSFRECTRIKSLGNLPLCLTQFFL